MKNKTKQSYDFDIVEIQHVLDDLAKIKEKADKYRLDILIAVFSTIESAKDIVTDLKQYGQPKVIIFTEELYDLLSPGFSTSVNVACGHERLGKGFMFIVWGEKMKALQIT